MSIVKETYDFLYNYFTIPVPPMKLEPKSEYIGCITPEHETVEVSSVEVTEDCVITPIHEIPKGKGTITRAFGDILPEELV